MPDGCGAGVVDSAAAFVASSGHHKYAYLLVCRCFFGHTKVGAKERRNRSEHNATL